MEQLPSNNHHIIGHMTKKVWRSTEEGLSFVEDPQFIARIDLDSHQRINKICSPVPVLPYISLVTVRKELRRFEPSSYPPEAIDHLFEAVERAKEHRRIRMGEIAILDVFRNNIAEQIPYIEEGLILG